MYLKLQSVPQGFINQSDLVMLQGFLEYGIKW